MKVKSYLSALFSIFFISASLSQGNVGINHFGFPPHPSAILDLSSFDQGFLMPRMESWVKWTIPNPAEGLMICDTTTKSIWIYSNNNWEELAMKYNTHFTWELGAIHNTGNLASDDFVFGSPQLDDDGNANHQKRMFFDKGKAAFRVGQLFDVASTPLDDESKRWDSDSLGIGSVALGVNTLAKSTYSVAIGANAVARGYGSVAIGNTVFAEGAAAVSLGISSAIGDRSFSAGSTNKANGYASSALGELTVANGKFSTSTGERTLANAMASVATGKFNVGGGDPLNWVLTDPLFEIGNAPDLSSRQNAFTVLKDGTMISGSHQVDDDPSRTNDNIRMYFHKGKAAFRAGEVYDVGGTASEDESKRWNVDSLGHGSVAIGRIPIASNTDAIAIGGNARARGYGSVAIGNTVLAKGAVAVALGVSNAIGDRSFASGSTNYANGYASSSMGELTVANGKFSTATGERTLAQAFASVAIGKFNVGTGDPLNWVLTDPLFEIGNAPNLAQRQNAFTVLKNGNTGIGPHHPINKVDVAGNLAIGNAYAGAFSAPVNGAIIQGRVGIGTTTPLSSLDIIGNICVGSSYAGFLTAPPEGAIIEGYVGIGTSYPYNRLEVAGNLAIGSTYSGSATFAPVNGALIEGKVGIGTSSVQNKLDVEGSVAIGSAYAGTAPGPVNGLAVEGNVGIGTLGPANKLDVNGKITLSQSFGDEMVIINGRFYGHSTGVQDFGDGGDYFMMASKEESNESAGIFGDGDYVTIWSAGDDSRLVRFLDEDFFIDADGDPYNFGAEMAYIAPDGSYNQVSDSRLKKEIKKIGKPIERISQINGYTYRFKRNAEEQLKGQKERQKTGVLAQELAPILPEAVSQNESGQYFVNYDAIIPVLIEGMKEQQKMIEELKEKVERLERKK